MKYKTLVRLTVRLIGIYFVIQFAASLLVAIGNILVAFSGGSLVSISPYYISSVAASSLGVLVGVYLARGGSMVVNYLIPSNRPYCHECGYELTLPASQHCPECGTEHTLPTRSMPGQQA